MHVITNKIKIKINNYYYTGLIMTKYNLKNMFTTPPEWKEQNYTITMNT